MPHEGIESVALTAGVGIIGVKPYHPVMKEAMMQVLNRWEDVTKNFSSSDPLMEAKRVVHRSYIALTYAFEKGLNQPDNRDIVFPACYFYPKHGLPGFYSEHLYTAVRNDLNQATNEKFFSQSLRMLRERDAKVIRVEFLSLLTLIGSFTFYFLTNRELKKSEGPYENH